MSENLPFEVSILSVNSTGVSLRRFWPGGRRSRPGATGRLVWRMEPNAGTLSPGVPSRDAWVMVGSVGAANEQLVAGFDGFRRVLSQISQVAGIG